jgi:hypothetical protein
MKKKLKKIRLRFLGSIGYHICRLIFVWQHNLCTRFHHETDYMTISSSWWRKKKTCIPLIRSDSGTNPAFEPKTEEQLVDRTSQGFAKTILDLRGEEKIRTLFFLYPLLLDGGIFNREFGYRNRGLEKQ